MNRGLPPVDLRPRVSHLFRLIDLALIAAIFLLAGRVYMDTKGEAYLHNSESLRQLAQQKGNRMLAEADSVLVAAKGNLARAQADSLKLHQELNARVAELDEVVAEQQRLAQAVFPLTEQILGQRAAASTVVKRVENNQDAIRKRHGTIDGLRGDLAAANEKLEGARRTTQGTAQALDAARAKREYDPVGLLPSRSGMLLSHEFGEDTDQTIVELQHKLARAGKLDLGVEAGVGFGAAGGSTKQLGLMATRLLVHRRVSLDASAGYSILTDEAGDNDTSPYGALGFRFSPFYREHFHLGLGARAARDGIMPYLGIGIGRR